MNTIFPDLIRALTNVEDGIVAQQEYEEDGENIETFKKEAQNALADFPETYPYIEQYRSSLNDQNFEEALSALKDLVSYVSEADTENEEVVVLYHSGAIDRIIDVETELLA